MYLQDTPATTDVYKAPAVKPPAYTPVSQPKYPTTATTPTAPQITPKAPTTPPVTGPSGVATQTPQVAPTPQFTLAPSYAASSNEWGGDNSGLEPPAPTITPPYTPGNADTGWGSPNSGLEPPTPPAPVPGGPLPENPFLPDTPWGGGGSGTPPPVTPPPVDPDPGNNVIDPKLPDVPPPEDPGIDFDPFNSKRLRDAFDFYSGRLNDTAKRATASADTNAASRGLFYSTIPEMWKTGPGGIQENLQNGLGQLSASLLIPEAQMTMDAQNNYVQQALLAAQLAGQGLPDLASILAAMNRGPAGGSGGNPYGDIGRWLGGL